MEKRQIGNLGEEIARKYLEGLGWILFKHNWYCKYGELDLILIKNRYLLFVEVKATNSKYTDPAYQITPHKLLKLYKSINLFCIEYALFGYESQLDAITINFSTKKLRHYYNITVD
ncbi:MAG: YraN family protein [Patescibacteria group bacterium]|uniref:UPF0102 protein KC980_01375 n=1 Tax=candidate division WWE3 bacterium TaxID=2053526 RepID=A0A955EDH6_UNCKA|nr:YraN family protein [candidate division WWE3 bacterium]